MGVGAIEFVTLLLELASLVLVETALPIPAVGEIGALGYIKEINRGIRQVCLVFLHLVTGEKLCFSCYLLSFDYFMSVPRCDFFLPDALKLIPSLSGGRTRKFLGSCRRERNGISVSLSATTNVSNPSSRVALLHPLRLSQPLPLTGPYFGILDDSSYVAHLIAYDRKSFLSSRPARVAHAWQEWAQGSSLPPQASRLLFPLSYQKISQ